MVGYSNVPILDELVKTLIFLFSVIPAKAGIKLFQGVLDPGVRRSDGLEDFLRVHQFFRGDNYPTDKTLSKLFFYFQHADSFGKDFIINHFLDQKQADKFFVLFPVGGKQDHGLRCISLPCRASLWGR